jgi:hypothetical protein
LANNLTIESPNFEKIAKEAGQFTSDAVTTLWAALNDTRATLRRLFRQASEKLEPKVLTLAPSATISNLDLEGGSVLSFTGSSAVNFTGMRAPESGSTRLVFVHNSGSATITVKHNATSETANQIVLSTGADYSMTTGKGIQLAYLVSKWREVARSG